MTNQVELDIAQYLLQHADAMQKPQYNMSIENQNRYKSLIQEVYEDNFLKRIKNNLSVGLSLDLDLISGIVNRDFIIRVLGTEFLKFEFKEEV